MPKSRNICAMNSYFLKLSFVWPLENEELDPKWFYRRLILVFLVSFLTILVPVFLHFLKSLAVGTDVSEDISLIVAWVGVMLNIGIYAIKQPNIGGLIRQLSDATEFGEPPQLQLVKKQFDQLAKIAYWYTTIGAVFYNIGKLFQIGYCNPDREVCGAIIPVSVPFEVDSSQKRLLVAAIILLVILIVDKAALLISLQVLEIICTMDLKIRHLNAMVFDAFQSSKPRAKLLVCVRYHNRIISCSRAVNECFSTLFLVQVVISAVICGCLENQILNGELIQPGGVLHMLGWTTSLFIICCAGQILEDSSRSIGDVLFNAEWYKSEQKVQRNLLLMIQRSQRQLFLSVGGFGYLCFALFGSIMKMSYSIFTLLS